ncbi:hypothetical protein [Arsukibacterium sp.]|uniref:hypothetical protein n=1 Tax=Arsukibacterium sp. TaxID=1977258 RepID=UPI002606E9B9|nr:hypothetical protein [Arsukibacterium sp.]
MKKLLLLALIAFDAWNYYQKQSTPKPIVEPAPRVLPDYTVPIQKARDVAANKTSVVMAASIAAR